MGSPFSYWKQVLMDNTYSGNGIITVGTEFSALLPSNLGNRL